MKEQLPRLRALVAPVPPYASLHHFLGVAKAVICDRGVLASREGRLLAAMSDLATQPLPSRVSAAFSGPCIDLDSYEDDFQTTSNAVLGIGLHT
jgi:hypothetical protein